MEVVSLNREPVFEEASHQGTDEDLELQDDTPGLALNRNPPQPTVGLEFDSFDEAYDFYNLYARQQGFGIRVGNSWFRSKQKERYRAKFSCSNAGFKRKSVASHPRPETRTGCPAMVIIRLVDCKRWRIIEVELQHNHTFSSEMKRVYKSHKKMVLAAKEENKQDPVLETRIIKLYRTPTMDSNFQLCANVGSGENRNHLEHSNNLELKDGDASTVYNFFCRLKLTDPNFFYLMDHDNEGRLKNIFWADSRSRLTYKSFNDTIMIETTCLASKYELQLISFVGVNNHGYSVLLGCSLVASVSVENFIWVLRTWLACMLQQPPQVVITDQSKLLQSAVAEVLPGARHCYSLWHIIQRLPEKLGGLSGYEGIKNQFVNTVFSALKFSEFETSWELMIEQHGLGDNKWLQALHEDCQNWVPVYLKNVFFAGLMPTQESDALNGFFDGYVHKHTTIKEFLDKYELALHRKLLKDAIADQESRTLASGLVTKSSFKLQLSKIYSKEIFKKFQAEVEGMYSCFNTKQLVTNGPVITYLIKERLTGKGHERIVKQYEVFYEATTMDVRCICCLFNFKGYLCRHALSVLNYIGIEEIPSQYILPRWCTDFKCRLGQGHPSNDVDTNDQLQQYHHLIRHGIPFVEYGAQSEQDYKAVLKELESIVDKVISLHDN
uniref:Protein FAR1-RELATED SEQUENCE n=1 Tax=Kalanchoe fedtschenkoi TaxID=63787 RepID=A0A7N0T8Y6_KALFE